MRSSRRRVAFDSRHATSRQSSKKSQRQRRFNKQDQEAMAGNAADFTNVPVEFRSRPVLKDAHVTKTSTLQAETMAECLPLLNAANDPLQNPFDFNSYGVPRLERDDHLLFLNNALGQFPAAFVGVDSSRPWMIYWALMGLHMLGEDVTQFRQRVIKTFTPMQNLSGGLGGGQGQSSHLAGSYAAILSLALVGGTEAYSLIDRKMMWHWLGRLKQPSGGFQICEGGEEDTRGAYCALVMISLLKLPYDLPPDAPSRKSGLTTFGDGLGGYLSRCQTYEGGISAAPGNEAHGAYAFCALACLSLLDRPDIAINRYLDLDALLSWLSSRQYAPEGGFAGRTNKLVDTCYSHWIGGCWPLVQAALDGPRSISDVDTSATVGNLYSRQGLARYILACCQAETGGLRDKPSKKPDSYHTCYALTGLSRTQHFHYFEDPQSTDRFASTTTWRVLEGVRVPSPRDDPDVSEETDSVRAVHPVYVISHEAVASMREWALALGPP